jgi:acyl transferase domain-containing protein
MTAVAVLIVGLIIAVGIYVSAGSTDDMIAYEIEHSKQYQRTLELYGGKANVMAVEITQWLDSLWHGTRLAYTVACASVLMAAGCWLAAALVDD